MSANPCSCPICKPNENFNPNECMFCHERINPKGGTLKSKSNARMCVTCLKECFKLLQECDKQEKVND